MIRPLLTRRHAGALAVLALGGGVAMAQAAGGSGTAARSTSEASVGATKAGAAARRVAQPAATPTAVKLPARRPIGPCMPGRRSAGGAPPTQALLAVFGILRRDRTAADELPAAALKALRLRGLEPVAPEAARLLRSAGDARAWVVPVADVDRANPFACLRGGARKPREGLAVVALGGAPAGGGGALRDLVRGTATVATDPCAGPAHDMLGVSGIVPDGVPAVFLTAPDGSAVRADVHGNGFSFVVAPARRPEPRYVVWTGSDGTPHVQPVPVFAGLPRGLCRRLTIVAEVTPSGVARCSGLGLIAPAARWRRGRVLVVPQVPRARRRPPVATVPGGSGRRVPPAAVPVPVAPPLFQPCAAPGAPPVFVLPPGVPPRALPAPARPAPLPAKPPRRPGP